MVYGGLTETWRWSDFVFVIFTGIVTATAAALLLQPFSGSTQLAGLLLAQYAGHLMALVSLAPRRGSSLGKLGLDVRPIDGLYLLGGVALQIAIAAASLPIAIRLGLDESSQALAESIPTIEGLGSTVTMIAVVAVIAPMTEEIMFRGLLPRLLMRRVSAVPAYGIAAVVFAASHMVGVTPGEDFAVRSALLLVQLSIVGAVLGWQAYGRRRLGTAIFIHSGFNLVALLALLIAPETFS